MYKIFDPEIVAMAFLPFSLLIIVFMLAALPMIVIGVIGYIKEIRKACLDKDYFTIIVLSVFVLLTV